MSAELSPAELLPVRARIHAALGDPARLAIIDTLLLGDASPGELARALDLPTNLLAHHVNVLVEVGLVVRTRSEADRRRTYLRLVAERLPALATAASLVAPRVVFVCRHNAARSQLAAALWARRSGVPTASAGTEPARRIHPEAVRVAHRHGLTLGRTRPIHVDDVLRRDDMVIAVCDNAHEELHAREDLHAPEELHARQELHAPEEPHRRGHSIGQWLHWSVPDPVTLGTETAFETAYAELAARVDRLAPTVTAGRTAETP